METAARCLLAGLALCGSYAALAAEKASDYEREIIRCFPSEADLDAYTSGGNVSAPYRFSRVHENGEDVVSEATVYGKRDAAQFDDDGEFRRVDWELNEFGLMNHTIKLGSDGRAFYYDFTTRHTTTASVAIFCVREVSPG